jgi:hypothetical protein
LLNSTFTITARFLKSKGWLQEEVEVAGHHVLFYPKFHCELNFIE